MLTVVMIDNDTGDYQAAKRAISQVCPSASVEGAMGAWIAEKRIAFYAKVDFEITVRLFVVEAKLNDGNPVELIQQIRAAKSLRHIPVVIYTNTDDDEAKRACLAAGASKVFTKGQGTKGAEALAAYVANLAKGESR